MTFRPLKVDEALLGQHHYLAPGDECFYLGDYYPGEGYRGGGLNDLILNLKKPVDRKGLPEYRWKNWAITRVAEMLVEILSKEQSAGFSFVPIPPSKVKTHPLYDDRLSQILRKVAPPLDVREVIACKASMRAHHEFNDGERRPTPDDVYANLKLHTAALDERPLKGGVILFDDVLTNGTHFKACQRLLLEHRSDLNVFGLFVGRRKVRPVDDDFDLDFDDL